MFQNAMQGPGPTISCQHPSVMKMYQSRDFRVNFDR